MLRTNNTNWVDYLQTCCDNKNTQRNATIKKRPTDAYNLLPHQDAERQEVAENIKAKAKRDVERNKTLELHVWWVILFGSGVKLTALYSQLRKMVN